MFTHPPATTAVMASFGAPSFLINAGMKIVKINTGKNQMIASKYDGKKSMAVCFPLKKRFEPTGTKTRSVFRAKRKEWRSQAPLPVMANFPQSALNIDYVNLFCSLGVAITEGKGI